jgi:ketosteroid isomerase-like protein
VTEPASAQESNRQVVAGAFEAWRDGRAPITGLFAPEMVWRIEGHSLASREYSSRQEFIDEVLAPFGSRFSTEQPFRPVNIRGVFADGDMVIVLWDGEGITTDNRPYANSYAWFMRLRDGKVVDGTAFYDSISFNELWTRVHP